MARRRRLPNDLRSGPRYKQYRAAIRRVHASQRLPCELCRKPIDYGLEYPHPFAWSLDHRIPVHANGAVFDPGNAAASHLRCNLSRGAKEGNAKRGSARHTSRRW